MLSANMKIERMELYRTFLDSSEAQFRPGNLLKSVETRNTRVSTTQQLRYDLRSGAVAWIDAALGYFANDGRYNDEPEPWIVKTHV